MGSIKFKLIVPRYPCKFHIPLCGIPGGRQETKLFSLLSYVPVALPAAATGTYLLVGGS